MDTSSRDFLELLDGNRTYPDDKRKEFFSMIDKKIRDDFINDLAIVLARSSHKDQLELSTLDSMYWQPRVQDVEYLERLVPEIECLKRLAPEIDKIFQDRTDSLKKRLINARIREFKKHSDDEVVKTPFRVSDWAAVRERFKAIRFDNDIFALFEKVTKEKNFGDDLFIYEDEGFDTDEEEVETSSPREASEIEGADEKYNLFDAFLNSAEIKEEIRFAKSVPEYIPLSYKINVSDNLFNELLFNALKSRSNFSKPMPRFISVSEFKNRPSLNDRHAEKEFDYSDLAEDMGSLLLCVEDLDLLPSLSSREFDNFRNFLKKNKIYNFFFFGDFDHPMAGFKNRMDELEMILNIRNIDAKKIEFCEKKSLRAAFASRKFFVPQSIEAIMLDAWSAFRNISRDGQRGDRIENVVKDFVFKTEFNITSKQGCHILDGNSFDWLGNSNYRKTGSGVPAKPTSLELLDSMIGMSEVKKEIDQIVSCSLISKLRRNAGLPVEPPNLSYLFLGNPGTGKTTTARILASALRELGILKKATS